MTQTLDTLFGRTLVKNIDAGIIELTMNLVAGHQKEKYDFICGQVQGLQDAKRLAEETMKEIEGA